MSTVHVTLLVEDLERLAAAVPTDFRYPSLERTWSRGRSCTLQQALTTNHLRFELFNMQTEGQLPIAALTHVNDRRARPDDDRYWLRADPVTLRADMARVFMTGHGFADLDPYERNEIERCVQAVLREEGFDLHADHPERWCIPLDKPIEFSFTPLEEALGMDVAEALPNHPEARYWRRILNEVQVALHHCPVNVRRRAAGRQQINSVWFWGGGFIPNAGTAGVADTVYSENAISRGLAIINDCRLRDQGEVLENSFDEDGRTVLIDWQAGREPADQELARLEALVARLMDLADRGRLDLTLYTGRGSGRIYGPRARRRFWIRRKPLSQALRVSEDA